MLTQCDFYPVYTVLVGGALAYALGGRWLSSWGKDRWLVKLPCLRQETLNFLEKYYLYHICLPLIANFHIPLTYSTLNRP